MTTSRFDSRPGGDAGRMSGGNATSATSTASASGARDALRTSTLTQQDIARRLDRLPVSRFHLTVLVVAALSLFFDTLDTVITGFVLATLRPLWGFDAATIGVISAIGLGGYLVGSALAGFAADRYGRKKMIMLTLVLYSLFSASRGLVSDVWSFAALNFFTWLFVGAESSIVPPYLAELWPTRVRGKLGGWMMGFFALGIAVSPIWALNIIPHWGWRAALFLTLPFAIVVGLMRSGLPESPRWLLRRGRAAEAEAVLASIEQRVGRRLPDEAVVPGAATTASVVDAKPAKTWTARDLLSPRFRKVTLMLWATWFAEYGVLYTFMTFVPTLLAMEGFSIVKSFEFSIAIYASVIPGYVFGGYVVDWLDRKPTAILAFIGTAIFGTLFGMSTTSTTLMAFGGLTSFCLALGSTAIYSYTPELYPTEIRATGMGLASAWGRAGAILLLLVFGVFAVLKGKLFVFVISDVILLVAAICIALFGPSTKGRSLEDASTGGSD
ncbi:MFS transporter [Pandoraea commovens]|uniref:MFS transporter n=1 Tax=Pandoraea commovens TaxID=2508289 RepID=A0A5E4XRZ8_9BURK|nr:MFS transporter [Pandoraea commovens]UVA80901.1 MFS transporter [Pandoraea commovens]VVE39033.1 Putative niacin/nicotinamide transporter NaiP [Pandoraea commovens]